jgi:hypothetical protein
VPNFLVWSDLHLERARFDMPRPDKLSVEPDAVLIAGDSDTNFDHIRFASRVFDTYRCPVIMVDGNHEFYGQNIDRFYDRERDLLERARSERRDIHILHGASVEIGGVRIIGATLWTDYNLDPVGAFAARQLAKAAIEDFKCITTGPQGRAFRPEDSIARHEIEKRAILAELQSSHEGPTIVMSHHLPIKQALHPRHHGNPYNPAFASDLAREIGSFDWDAWIFGHSHSSRDFEVVLGGKVRRFFANTRGYSHENADFDPLGILTI